MVKNTIKQYYGLVDSTSKEELQAALLALESTDTVVEEVKETFGDATLADGESKIYFPGDELTIGASIFIDEAMETIAEAGEYTLENGDILIVDEAGLVLEITPAGEEAPEEAPEEQDATPASIKETTTTETTFNEEVETEEVGMVEQVFEALQPLFDTLNSRLEALENVSKENEDLKEELSKTEAKVEKLAKSPAAAPYTGKGSKNSTPNRFAKTTLKSKLGIK